MKHEKIIKRENIDYKLEVSIFIPDVWDRIPHRYDVMLFSREKGKRKWIHIPTKVNDENEHLKYVTKDELLETKLELWNKLKPE